MCLTRLHCLIDSRSKSKLISLDAVISPLQNHAMSKRSRTTDPILLASRVFKHVAATPNNPAAVALGKLGGPKGGPARAKALSPERRSEIASRAAKARWTKYR